MKNRTRGISEQFGGTRKSWTIVIFERNRKSEKFSGTEESRENMKIRTRGISEKIRGTRKSWTIVIFERNRKSEKFWGTEESRENMTIRASKELTGPVKN